MNLAQRCLHRAALPLALAATLQALVGCGTHAGGTFPAELPAPTPSPVSLAASAAPSALPAPSHSPTPAPVLPSAAPSPSGSPAAAASPLAAAQQAYANVQDYSCYIRGYAKGGNGSQTMFLSYSFAKPGSIKLQVLAADDPDLQGATIVYTGGDKLTYRGQSGFAHEFPQTLPLNDPRTLTGLGNNVSQSGIGWMLQRLTQPGASAVPLQRPGETAVVGRPVTWYQVTSPALTVAGFARELIAVDQELNLPISHEIYTAGGEQVYQATLQVLKINPGLPADTFKP